jgi:hypothetical protein
MLIVVLLSGPFNYCYTEYCYAVCLYAERHYAECHYVECYSAECRYAECHYAERRYNERRYTECRYAECCGAPFVCSHLNFPTNFFSIFQLKRDRKYLVSRLFVTTHKN